MDKIKQEPYFRQQALKYMAAQEATASANRHIPIQIIHMDNGAMLANALLALKFKYKTLVAETLFALGMGDHWLQSAMPSQGQGGMAT